MEIGRLQAAITADDRDFREKMRRADQTGKQTARSIGSSFSSLKLNIPSIGGQLSKIKGEVGSAFAGIGTELLTGAISKVTAGFSLAIKTGLDFNKMMEGASIVFENLTGSADNAVKHLNGLKEFAKSSPFDLPDLIQASARMQAFGFSTAEVLPQLKNLQNAAALAAGTSGNFTESLNGIVTALGQMRANGRVSAEEMNQLTERGIPAWELLASKIGKTVAETRKLSEEGKLRGAPAADALLEAFGEGKFAGLGEKLAKTTLGKESNLRDALTQQAGDAAKDTVAAYNSALDEALRQTTRQGSPVASLAQRANAPVAAGIQIATDISSGLTTAKDIGRVLIPTAKDTVVELGILLKDGIAGAWRIAGEVASGAAEQAGVSMGEAAIKGTKGSLQSQSPSRVYIEIGEGAAAGFQIGFENGKKKILTANEKLVAELKKQWERAQSEFAAGFEEASKKTGLPVELLMGVASRETNMRNIIGDRGRGAGVMQVDIGTDAAFKASGAWKDATASIIRGAEILKEKFEQLIRLAGEEVTIRSRAGEKFKFEVPALEGEQLKQTAVASYNSGLFAARNVSLGRSVDASTTGRDYSADVLRRAEIFKQLRDGVAGIEPKAKDAAIQLGNLATTLQTVAQQAKSFPGQTIQGGGASIDIAARRFDLLPTISAKEAGLSQQLDMATTRAAAALKAMADAAKPIPQAVEQAAQKTRVWADEIIQTADKFGNASQRLDGFKERLGQGFDDLIGALITGSDRWQDVARNVAVDFFNTLASEMMLAATGGKHGSLGGLLGGLIGDRFGGIFSNKQPGTAPITPPFNPNAGTGIVESVKDSAKTVADSVKTAAKGTTDAVTKTGNQSISELIKLSTINAEMASCACAPPAQPSLLGSILGAVVGAVGAGFGGGGGEESGSGFSGPPSGGYYTGSHGVPMRRRAGGGRVMAGMPYLIGEEGPEMFAPGMNGAIIPAGQTRQMMNAQPQAQSITVVNNFTIQAPGGRVAPETQQQIATKAAQAMQAAIARNA